MLSDPFILLALITSVISAILILWFLIRRPALTRSTKVTLLFGIGVLPLATAANGNIAGYHAMKTRNFCGSCHVMTPYKDDAGDLQSLSLAARHGRNEAFGAENCYTCHADYGMYGTITTKIGGLRHVYEYALNYRNMPLTESITDIRIRKPFPNSTCIRCHSTENPLWRKIGDHESTRDEIRAGSVSCASAGCHGAAHVFSDDARAKLQKQLGAPAGGAK